MIGHRSIVRDLAVRLALIFLVSPLLAVPVLLLIDDETPDVHIDRVIEAQADAAAALLSPGPDGRLTIAERKVAAQPLLKAARFAIYGAASPEPLIHWPPGDSFRNWDYHRSYDTYRSSGVGPIRLLFVAAESDGWVEWIRSEIVTEILPLLAIMMAVTLPLAIFTVRRSLAPVRRLAGEAAAIEPGAHGARLDEAGTPSELFPLVRAINGALERIDAGFTAQRRFSANIAHELRSPLAALSVTLEQEPSAANLAQVRQRLRGMARLIDQLLTVSELSARRLKADEDVDLNKVARGAVAEEAPNAVAAGIAIELEAPDRPVPIKGNAVAIGTALRNLISNAVRHSAKGDCVTVTLLERGPALEVADRGPGIPADKRATVFEPFWRGPRSRGSGVGLAIVQQMAELHGARVGIRDNVPTGSIFRIDFGAT